MPSLTQGSVTQIRKALRPSDGLAHLKDASDDRVAAALDAVVHGFIGDDMEAQMSALFARPSFHRTDGMDDVTAALLVDHGLHPAALLTLSHLDVVNLEDDKGWLATLSGGAAMSVRLAETSSASWRSFGAVHMPDPLPDTIRAAFEPVPLCDLVSHPVLDRMPLRAQGIETLLGGGTRIKVSGARWPREAGLREAWKGVRP